MKDGRIKAMACKDILKENKEGGLCSSVLGDLQIVCRVIGGDAPKRLQAFRVI